MAPPKLISTTADFAPVLEAARRSGICAFDTESDSFFHYFEKICLVQISVNGPNGVVDYLIDPLASAFEPAPLVGLLSDPSVVKIVHDAGYDALLVRRQWQTPMQNVFDTMIGARLCGLKQFGLAALLQQFESLTIDKSEQRSDWSQRPLTSAQLEYAAADTRHLFKLQSVVAAKLDELGRRDWHTEDCARLLRRSVPETRSEEDKFQNLKGVRKLRDERLWAARALFGLREKIAQEFDRPVFRVFGNDVLLSLAEEPPRDMQELDSLPGIGRRVVQKHGQAVLAACHTKQAYEFPPREKFSAEQITARKAAEERFEKLREKRRTHAERMLLDPEILLGNAALHHLADNKPVAELDEYQGWRKASIDAMLGSNGAPLAP